MWTRMLCSLPESAFWVGYALTAFWPWKECFNCILQSFKCLWIPTYWILSQFTNFAWSNWLAI